MKTLLRNLLPALAVLLLLPLLAAQVAQLAPFSADLEISSTRGNSGTRDMQGKIFVATGHMRLNIETAGHPSAVITDFATKTGYFLMIQEQMYVEYKAGGKPGRVPGSPAQDLEPYDPEHPCSTQPNLSCKKIGVEEVNRRTCDHWEMTDKQDKVSNVWIDQKLHFPIKLVSQDSTMTLTNIKEGQPDDNLFQIPAGFHKMDLGGVLPPGAAGPPQQ